MVYSTCSLNPVENEAVVYNLLLKFKDQLELVDARDKLPGLKTLKGLLTWNLMSKTGEIYNKVEEVKPEFVNLMRPYMFPPELSVAKELNLDRCIRVLPHHQNTGGFFIAVIRKIAPVLNVDLDANFISSEVKPKVADGPPEADMSRVMKAPPAKR
jgi:tRNA (cytosine34-C5)-methyltransferase